MAGIANGLHFRVSGGIARGHYPTGSLADNFIPFDNYRPIRLVTALYRNALHLSGTG